mgnify:CR=1 FL=1
MDKSIDQIIEELRQIVEKESKSGSSLALFAALYLQVTIRVKQGIRNHEFENGIRMEQLDVIFADRYIQAYRAFRDHKPITAAWRVAFESERKPLLILQHLLLGMNAHINLDLGIAAAQTMKGKDLYLLKNDFNAINRILSAMSDDVQQKIGKASPLLGMLDRLAGRSDTLLVNFSITQARDGAWKSAGEFHKSDSFNSLLVQRDKTVSNLALSLVYPNSRRVRMVLNAIRLAETRDVAKVVRLIAG